MVSNGGVVTQGDLRHQAGALQATHQLFHLVGEGGFHLLRGGGAHPHQAAFEAFLAGDTGLFVAGDADAGDARLHH